MVKKITKIEIPLWIALLIILISGLSFLYYLTYIQQQIQNYELLIAGPEGKTARLEYGSWPALANADFFKSFKSRFVSSKFDFIEADLSQMKLTVYEKGRVVREAPILTKGKKGSWWETPAGIYKIESKEENHFSSIGRVYQPWSLIFQGNFFIHGWPYYEGGRPVGSTYSGGCIRISTEDAKEIFKLAEVGTPILVFEDDFSADNFRPQSKGPELSATSYLAADLKSNFVFIGKDTQESVSVASITKLMTAVVAVEYINLDKKITITESMIVKTSRPRLRVGEKISAFNLLYPLLLESSNEAAIALSRPLGPIRFVELMNKKAEALGMLNTHFTDPTGGEDANKSTAEDLFNLAKYLYNNRSFVLKVTTGRLTDSAYGSPIFDDLKNFNVFYKDRDFIGGKVGKTATGRGTMFSIFETAVNGEDRPIVIVVLGSDDGMKDTQTTLDYIRERYK